MKHTIDTIKNLNIANQSDVIEALWEVATRLFLICIFFGVEDNKNVGGRGKYFMDMYRELSKRLGKEL